MRERTLGVRESLETQTRNMAKTLEVLLEDNLRYSNGDAVECVIVDTIIGGVKEAADCARKFEEDSELWSISVTPYWCYGTEIIFMDERIPQQSGA